MSELFIEDKALQIIKKELAKENTNAVRIFVSGGGCCPRFEIVPVKKPLTGDVTYNKGGITLYVEKYLVDNTTAINIGFDEKSGLLIDLIE